MKYTQGKYPIIEKTTLAKEVYDLTILCPDVAEAAEMGQFVNVFVEGRTLRRPISLCGIDKEKGTIRLVFEVRGNGTKEMSALNAGGLIDILAPLGRGWKTETKTEKYENAIIIGGGIGTPPMLPIAEFFGKNATVITGFRNAAAVILQEDFKKT
ncbi:MAG: dihydroorotate dehydrogenase electron transfer subunit, partial [Oscillospiraceae bacterium]